jgi:uncharacterized membrane protein YuzA (DUF378 family)
MSKLDWISLVAVTVGGINWGLVGVFDWNLVEAVLGGVQTLEKIVYILIGLSALYMIGKFGRTE